MTRKRTVCLMLLLKVYLSDFSTELFYGVLEGLLCDGYFVPFNELLPMVMPIKRIRALGDASLEGCSDDRESPVATEGRI